MKRSDKTSEPAKTPKKPYRKPVLQVYGDIRAITRNVSIIKTHLNDFGGGGKTKT